VTGVWNLFFLLLAAGSPSTPNVPAPNWSGQYAPCNRHPDLLNHGHVNLGVRIATANPALARQFERAMEFWRGVVDLDWHEEDSVECSVQLVDGEPDLFDGSGIAARSQFPDRPEFQGWVAFNPGSKLTEHEMFIVSVHEIGHLLGLAHNPSGSSVMYFFRLDGLASLDASDLYALADHHKLRGGILGKERAKEGAIIRPVTVPY
jgi:Matrixin